MIVIADTNVLIRLLVKDDIAQFDAACALFENAGEIILTTTVCCEVAWVLLASYKIGKASLSEILRGLLGSRKITAREDEIEAGLAMLQAGGDFADGVHAYVGRTMTRGTAMFASFDQQAVRLLTKRGIPAMLPDSLSKP